jgi:hypothetical protein
MRKQHIKSYRDSPGSLHAMPPCPKPMTTRLVSPNLQDRLRLAWKQRLHSGATEAAQFLGNDEDGTKTTTWRLRRRR